ncbi:hypothetical protein [Candidatus Merdisoma sp. JLR.KK006]|uniref:hypothetical protein n=1 Tax=Candidatus Merdisoma sp. JLR.KK006 TaxID=3112626 RepID=UPI002FF1202D
MNTEDEKSEDILKSEETESLEELTQQKRSEKEFCAENNTAQTQIFINSMNGDLNWGYRKIMEEVEKQKRKKEFDLREREECAEFVERFRDSEYLALALILCVFEAMAVSELPELKSGLLGCLPITPNGDNESRERTNQDPYLSLNTILNVIGGHQFITEDGQKCVSLGENSVQALNNILEQFPTLRNSVVCWLLELSDKYMCRTAFDAYQIAMAFARVISLDIADAKSRIFPRMYSNPGNAELLGTLAYVLYQDTECRRDIKEILSQWVKSDSRWFWKAASMTCLFLVKDNEEFPYEEDLKRAIKRNLSYIQNNEWMFLRELLFSSKYFRTMIAEIFAKTNSEIKSRNGKTELARQYINLIRRCYYKVNSILVELPLVACDAKKQQKFLSEIVKKVMSEYYLRKQLYILLEAYLKEISSYTCSEDVLNHISAYFYNMALSDLEYQQDVLSFLKNCQNSVSEQIYKRLYIAYDNKRRVGLT